MKKLNPTERAKKNPTSYKAGVAAYCYDCSGFNRAEVKHCQVKNCPLYNLRPYKPKQETLQ